SITMLAARCLNSREKTLLSFMEPPNWRNHIALKRCPELLGQFSLAPTGFSGGQIVCEARSLWEQALLPLVFLAGK
ncbi:hypothetical protein, partial [Pseudomonas sp. A-RE-23]|uniref:hypothetical protein n=1 Tax=Pseudomonas sp. A-RE-23 TaxID=2832376 RepID=UPI001CC19F4D